MKPWFEVVPERLQYELDGLDELGLQATVDEARKAMGRLVLAVEGNIAGQHISLEAEFPDTYPKTRMEVFARSLNLKRHQNPFAKNLCLLGAATVNWNPSDTLAGLLKTQLPIVLKIGDAADPEQYKDEEDPQGEPFSLFYETMADSCILVDSSWVLPLGISDGELEVSLEKTKFPLRGAVTKVSGGGAELAAANPKVAELYRDKQRSTGHWIRWPGPIVERTAKGFLDLIFAKKPAWKRQKGPASVLAVVFKEEYEQGKFGDGWIFIVRTNKGDGLVRAARAGRGDLQARVPELRCLMDKRIAVVGLGTLGAPSAVEFARCGVGAVHLGDFDNVEAGTVCRWPLGLSAAGIEKTHALEGFLRSNYPYTEISMFAAGVGRVMQAPSYSDLRDLERLIDADLVYDATAEIGVQHILAEAAVGSGKPYIQVTATAGLWGGVVARIVPGKTGCWMCLQRKIDSKEYVPAPMSLMPGVQAQGCGSPTFTGSGFDAVTIAMSGVRLAVQTLSEGKDGYPDVPWDIAIIALRDENGAPIAPKFTEYKHDPTPGCPSCG